MWNPSGLNPREYNLTSERHLTRWGPIAGLDRISNNIDVVLILGVASVQMCRLILERDTSLDQA